jgi:hypothetical protein
MSFPVPIVKSVYHLVGKNAVNTVLIKIDLPVETLDLVVSHFAPSNI